MVTIDVSNRLPPVILRIDMMDLDAILSEIPFNFPPADQIRKRLEEIKKEYNA